MFVLPKTPAERALEKGNITITSMTSPLPSDETVIKETGEIAFFLKALIDSNVEPLTEEQVNKILEPTPAFVKHDSGKLRWDLLPWYVTEEVVEVLTYGATKYTPNNWRNAGDTLRFLAAAMRHISAYAMGQKRDPETGIHHLAHAICNLMFIVEWEKDHNVTD